MRNPILATAAAAGLVAAMSAAAVAAPPADRGAITPVYYSDGYDRHDDGYYRPYRSRHWGMPRYAYQQPPPPPRHRHYHHRYQDYGWPRYYR